MRRLALWLVCLAAHAAHAEDLPVLAVICDQKLALPMAEITREYTRGHHIAVSLAFLSRTDETTLVTDEAYADVLITAEAERIEKLRQQGVVDIRSETQVAKNHLVLAGNMKATVGMNLARGFPLAALINAMQGEPLLMLGNPETLQEGTSAREALHAMQAAADLEPYIVYLKQLSQMLRMITRHDAFALMYVSDVRSYPELKVLAFFDEKTYTPVAYRAVALAGDKMKQARAFIGYLQGKEAQKVLVKYGVGE